MGAFDIIVVAIIGIVTIIGFWKGMVKQIFGLLGVIAGYILAVRFYHPFSKSLPIIHPGIARVVSFIAIFLACMLIAHLIGWGIGRFFAKSKLGFLNRIGGGFLGFLKGCILVAVLVTVLTTFLSANNSLFKKSSTMKYIRLVTTVLKKVTREDIKAKYEEKTGTEKPRPKQK